MYRWKRAARFDPGSSIDHCSFTVPTLYIREQEPIFEHQQSHFPSLLLRLMVSYRGLGRWVTRIDVGFLGGFGDHG